MKFKKTFFKSIKRAINIFKLLIEVYKIFKTIDFE